MDSSLKNTQTFEQVEAFLIKQGLLHFVTHLTYGTEIINCIFTKGNEVKEFLVYNNVNRTYTIDNVSQCYPNCRRTIGDIFRTLKHYCHYITLEEVHTQLNNCDGSFGCIICGDINKRVWRTSYTYINCGVLDEYGFQYKGNTSSIEYDHHLKFINVKG